MLTFENRKKDIIAAMDGTPYSLTEEGARLNALTGKIRWFSQIRGNALSEEDISETAKTLDETLMRYYDSLPLKEVELALEWEMVTGESIRLTVHNMLKGVAKYLNSDERKAAFAQIRRERGEEDRRPLTEQETRLLDFEKLRKEVMDAWEGYLLGGSLEPYRPNRGETNRDGWRGNVRDALRISQRHVYAGCYAWLKTYGVVADNDETKRREKICIANAVKEGVNATGIYAESLMLEWTFKEAAEKSRDLGSEINMAAGTVTEIVRMNTPLRHLKTN